MELDPSPGNKTKVVLISVLAGAGIVIGAFLISTILVGVIGLLLVSLLLPSCWESCPLTVLALSPLVGGLIAIVAGILGGRKIYQHVKGENPMNLPKQLSTWFMAVFFLLSGLHGVLFAMFPAATFWTSVGNVLWGVESLFAIAVAVLLFTGK